MTLTNPTKTSTETRQSRDWHARRQCDKARELERAGDYEGARSALAGLWSKIGEPPELHGLPEDTQAEILLRVGAVAGWLGSARQISGAQEFAKDLIATSARLFESVDALDRSAEAQVDLAICYWREGAFDEARILLREALGRAESADCKTRALLNSATIEIADGNSQRALQILDQAAPLLALNEDPSVQGRFHMQRGVAYKKLGGPENLDRALIEDTAAIVNFERAGHTRYVARNENNIGLILLELGRAAEAMNHLDRARQVFLDLKDSGSVAQVNETRARVLIAQGRYADAERVAFAAVNTLEQGDERSLLCEALISQATALARLGKHNSAQAAFERAAEVVEVAGDDHSAANARLVMIEELRSFLTVNQLTQLFLRADSQLKKELSRQTVERLRSCMRIVASSTLVNFEDHLIGGTLEAEMLHFEAQVIKRALDRAHGSVTSAARALGITHQGLAYILENRHKSLARARTPPRRRMKSIIKKH